MSFLFEQQGRNSPKFRRAQLSSSPSRWITIRRLERLHRKNVVPLSKFFDLLPHDRPIIPAVVQIHVHHSTTPNRDHRLLDIEESRSGLDAGRHANTNMELQQNEEDEGEGVTALKTCTKTGDLNLFLGDRSVAR